MLVGVLALQGGFAKHIAMLKSLGVPTLEVRTADGLNRCSGLIIPGGESTTMTRSIAAGSLYEPLSEFFKTKPVFGTCAGIILMSKRVTGGEVTHFSALDIDVERNAFGRQAESFSTEIAFENKNVHAVFIRAPRIQRIGPEVKVLATFDNEPILVQQGKHLGSTFHPELTSDNTIHKFFLSLI